LQYAELHAKTNFSFQEGASHPAELVERAAELGYAALAVTDRNSLAGVVRAHGAAKPLGLKLVIGAEITPEDALPVVLWAPDRAAYGRLARLITEGHRRAEKGECRIVLDDLVRHAEGLLAGVCVADELRRAGGPGPLLRQVEPYRVIFGDRCSLLAELHYGPDDARLAEQYTDLSRRARIALLAAGGVHYHAPCRAALHDVLTAVRHHATVDEARAHLFANAERHLQPLEAVAARFHFSPAAVRRALEIAQRCTFSLDELRYEYPEELAPRGQTPIEYLKQLTWAGAGKRYPQGVPERIQSLLQHEFALVEDLHYEAYFLTVWDLVRFARSRGILCQGRGSAANSVVCYCLGITSVDPDRLDVLFERFVSRERNEAPDIDVDFEHERREEVIQYVYEKYGRDRAGMTAEVISYRPRMAVRDVGKALGLAAERIDALAKNLEHFHADPDLAARCREAGIDPHSPTGVQLIELVEQLQGFPRHLSQHTGGMVITRGPLCELVPIENAAMVDRTVIEWNKDDLDELGILKVDCLALGMLTAIRKTFELVRKHSGQKLTLATVPESDPAVYEMIRQADTMGVFQIESRAQMSMLPRLRPRCFYDLVIEVAIVRPGPIQGDMVHPYLRRRAGLESVTYPSEEIRAVLEKTLGVPLFQEQAMRLAVVAAGFTPGEADQLRRAMAAWRRPGLIDEFHQKLIRGMTAQGLTPEYAEAVFRQIRGFGEYGFPESHAASFALLVYVSAWLKCHAMAAFTAGLLNSEPLGFYAPAQLVRNAREHGVSVLPADVNRSEWDCTLEEKMQDEECGFFSLRLGLRMLDGLGEAQGRRIEEVRGKGGPFRSLEDFVRRTGLGRAVAVRLSKAGAMESLGLDRRGALWHALAQDSAPLPLLDQLETQPDERPESLPAMSAAEEVLADYRTAGLSLRAHPLSFLRADLARRGVTPAGELRGVADGRPVRVAGIVLVRQRPGTAKGITFVTLEDESGQANLIIRPDVWRKFRQAAIGATLLLVHGRLQRQNEVTHILVGRIEDYSEHLKGLGGQSRNFR
jgi:error-prone DNA polymerase